MLASIIPNRRHVVQAVRGRRNAWPRTEKLNSRFSTSSATSGIKYHLHHNPNCSYEVKFPNPSPGNGSSLEVFSKASDCTSFVPPVFLSGAVILRPSQSSSRLRYNPPSPSFAVILVLCRWAAQRLLYKAYQLLSSHQFRTPDCPFHLREGPSLRGRCRFRRRLPLLDEPCY